MKPNVRTHLAQAGVLMGLAAVALVGIGLMLFVLDLRTVAKDAINSQQALRAVLLARCEARIEYDTRFVRGAEGDAKLYGELLAIADRIPVEERSEANDATRLALQLQAQALRDAKARKEAIVAQGVIKNCAEIADADGH